MFEKPDHLKCCVGLFIFEALNIMLSEQLKNSLLEDDSLVAKIPQEFFRTPFFDPLNHYKDLSDKKYFYALLILRHYIKAASDYYFGSVIGAKSVDLFMITSSVSSPMGPGSDSEAIKIKFGENETFLVDSSQFGFEPLLLNGFDRVYCYLPSMRGENPDNRHINQFYHCELEMKGMLYQINLIYSIFNLHYPLEPRRPFDRLWMSS